MSLFKRATEVIEAKFSKLINAAEDPNDTLDLSYEKMLAGLQETRRHLADVVTEQKVLEQQMAAAQAEITRHDGDARMALQANREDLARDALTQKQAATDKLASLTEAHNNITAQVQKLVEYERKFQDRIDAFRTQKEVLKSQYSSAQAQVKVNESLSGLSQKLGGVGENVRRAKDKTEQMQARAQAIDTLADSGALDDGDDRSSAERELEKLRAGSAVDAELARLKGEIKK
ncbi:PspA/IM30 family protein [Acidiferrobacter sp.]|uniref:PspA/IM30 family protein n=1 Tax=Acidiferrobacter sp. TaxID=1872107 RepID=UPI002611B014|nr:PspA/IM30 family protein [Acidiferrobacter sp.]